MRSSALVLIALALALTPARGARAATFNVPCDLSSLSSVASTVNTNSQEDVVWLAPGCVYSLAATWIVYPDGGFPVTIHGRGATISGKSEWRAFIVDPGATLYLNDLTVTDGATPADGGGIHNGGDLTLTDCTVSGSDANMGGGIFNAANARLTLIRGTVSGNSAAEDGGGILNRRGRLTLIGTTVSGNSANSSSGNGGGIYSDRQTARAMLANCTLTGNSSRFGAGVFNDEGKMTLSHCTVAGNVTAGGGNGGGIYQRNYFGTGMLRLNNSIVGDTVFEIPNGYDCVLDPSNQAPINASGGNIVEDGSCDVLGALSGDPKLGELTGKPAYFPLLSGSPAIDAASNVGCAGIDQRGAQRPQDGNGDQRVVCDLGSYEAP